jgi:hypothetical protein
MVREVDILSPIKELFKNIGPPGNMYFYYEAEYDSYAENYLPSGMIDWADPKLFSKFINILVGIRESSSLFLYKRLLYLCSNKDEVDHFTRVALIQVIDYAKNFKAHDVAIQHSIVSALKNLELKIKDFYLLLPIL